MFPLVTLFHERCIDLNLKRIDQKFKDMAASAGYSDPEKYYQDLKEKQPNLQPLEIPEAEAFPEANGFDYAGHHFKPMSKWGK